MLFQFIFAQRENSIFLSILEIAWGLRDEKSSLEVCPDFPIEIGSLLSEVKNFFHGGGVFLIALLHSAAGNLWEKDLCVCCVQ